MTFKSAVLKVRPQLGNLGKMSSNLSTATKAPKPVAGTTPDAPSAQQQAQNAKITNAAKQLDLPEATQKAVAKDLAAGNPEAATAKVMDSPEMKKNAIELGEASNKLMTGSPDASVITDNSLLGGAKKLAEADGTFKPGDPMDIKTIMKQIADDIPEADMHPIARAFKKMMKEQTEARAKQLGGTKEAWYKSQKFTDAMMQGIKYLLLIGSVIGGFFLIAKMLADQKSGCYMYEAGKTAKAGEQMCRQSDCRPGQNCGIAENKCNGSCCDGAGSSCDKSSRCGCVKFDVPDGVNAMTEGIFRAVSDMANIAGGGLSAFSGMLNFLLKYAPAIGGIVVCIIIFFMVVKAKETFFPKKDKGDDGG